MVDGGRSLGTFLKEGIDPLFGAFVSRGYRLGWEESGAIAKKSFVGGHP